MSRQRFTSSGSVSERKRSMRSWVSTWVSACGWKTSFTPYSLKQDLGELVGAGDEVLPLLGVELAGLRRRTAVLVGVLLRQVHEVLRADRGEQPGLLAELGDRLVQRVLALVQPGEDRAAADREVALGQLLLQLGGVLRHEALRAELGVDVAHARRSRRGRRPTSPGGDRWGTTRPRSPARCRGGAGRGRTWRSPVGDGGASRMRSDAAGLCAARHAQSNRASCTPVKGLF